MTNEITTREWEALSAYLDKELPVNEASRLEARLQTQPELRRALDELRRTRAVLRSQPKLKAPRNFTLTPEMVGQRRAGSGFHLGWFSTFRMASAMAAVFLVLVLITDLFSGAPVGTQVAQAPEGVAEAVPAEVPAAEALASTNIPPEMGAMAEEMRSSAKGSGEAEREMPAAGEEAAEEPAAELMMAPTEETASALAAPAAEGQAAPESEAFSAEEPIAIPDASLDQAQDSAVEGFSEPAPAEAPNPVLPGPQTLRVVEIALAVIAVLTGLGAYLLRKFGRA